MIKKLYAYLLVLPEQLFQHDPRIWKTSVLRIIVFSSLLLITAIVTDYIIQAYRLSNYGVIAACVFLYSLLASALFIPVKFIRVGAALLTVAIALLALSLLLFSSVFELAKLGVLILYVLPVIVRIFFGIRQAVGVMLLNGIIYLVLLNNNPLPQFFSSDISIDVTHTHVQSLIFLFFNVVIPLAVFRVLNTLERTSETYRWLNAEISRSKEVYKDVFENSGASSLIVDAQGVILKVNNNFLQLTGFSKDNVVQSHITEFIVNFESLDLKGQTGTTCQLNSRTGQYLDCRLHHSRLSENGRYLFSISDISVVKKAEQSLIEYEQKKQYLKHYDTLTKLPNRYHLLTALKDYIGGQRQTRQVFGVMTFRVNYFRYIDQKYGTAKGDQLLQILAEKIALLTQEHFLLARLRGIVFCLVTKSYGDYRSVIDAVESLYHQLPKSVIVEDSDIHLSYCSGVSIYPLNTAHADELITQSERALDLSRTVFSPKPVFFDVYLNAEQNSQIEIELKIKEALEKREFYTVYQPKVLFDGTIIGAEVLIRMRASMGESIGPELFIPAAERCGLINEVEAFVLTNVCQFIKSQLEAGVDIVPVAVNISAQMISETGYAEKIIDTIKAYNVPPSKIELEITETSLMTDKQTPMQNLIRLQEYGLNISIDDFGTGYSSLGKIIDMPVSALKIDRSFLRHLPKDLNQVTLIRTVINLGKQLKLDLVAEGVENQEQLKFLKDEGCEIFQGYYFYKPLFEADFTRLMLNGVTDPSVVDTVSVP